MWTTLQRQLNEGLLTMLPVKISLFPGDKVQLTAAPTKSFATSFHHSLTITSLDNLADDRLSFCTKRCSICESEI